MSVESGFTTLPRGSQARNEDSSRNKRQLSSSTLPKSISTENHVSGFGNASDHSSELLNKVNGLGILSPEIRSHSSSEEDVTISLGIQDTLGKALNAALTKVGSISMAWQHSAHVDKKMVSGTINPNSVFERVPKDDESTHTSTRSIHGSTYSDPQRADVQIQAGRSQLHNSSRKHRSRTKGKGVTRTRSNTITSILSGNKSTASDGIVTVNTAVSTDIPRHKLDGGLSDHTIDLNRRSMKRRSRRRERQTLNGWHEIAGGSVSPTRNPPAQTGAQPTSKADKRRSTMSIRLSLNKLLPPQPIQESALLDNKSPSQDISFTTPLSVPLSDGSGCTVSPRNRRNSDIQDRNSKVKECTHRKTASMSNIDLPLVVDEQAFAVDKNPDGAALDTLPEIESMDPISQPQEHKDDKEYQSVQHTGTAHTHDNSESHDESRLAYLEEQVSLMLNELGIEEAKQLCDGHAASDGTNVRMEAQVPWFCHPRYSKPHKVQPDKEIHLVDDDSSCGDTGFDSQSLPGRKLTSASAVSTAVGSIGSTFADSAHLPSRRQGVPHLYTYTTNPSGIQSSAYFAQNTKRAVSYVCPKCRDSNPPCNKMKSIIERLDHTDAYVRNIARHATAIDALLADLRAQSYALAETLATSGSRVSALDQTVANTIILEKQLANDIIGLDEAASGWLTDRANRPMAAPGRALTEPFRENYRMLSKKVHNLETKVQLLGSRKGDSMSPHQTGTSSGVFHSDKSHIYSWIKDAVAISAQATSASESELPTEYTISGGVSSIGNSHNKDNPSATSRQKSSLRSHEKAKRRTSRRKHHHRRPVQPIPVRVSRINSQWADLCKVIDELGIGEIKTPDSGSVVPEDDAVNVVAADGLRLIQRVMKATIESINELRIENGKNKTMQNNIEFNTQTL